jgi:alanine dehydrogenase
MLIGVPKEIKDGEKRVGLTPAAVAEFIKAGHKVSIEWSAGEGAGFFNGDYRDAGAQIAADGEKIWHDSDLIIKVKEPQSVEVRQFSEGRAHTLFCYLHLAANEDLVKSLLASGKKAIAYESVKDKNGRYPLLVPMSRIAGRLAVQQAASLLQKHKGILLGPIPGTKAAKVLVIGGGTAGEEATRLAMGMGAQVTVLDVSLDRLAQLQAMFGFGVQTGLAIPSVIENECRDADVVIGAVYVPSALAPKLVTAATVSGMRTGSVMIDISIDQGGCFETSRPTTHSDPTYEVHRIIHYCVANMPAAVPVTATQALVNATLPYALKIAGREYIMPDIADGGILNGVVAKTFPQYPFTGQRKGV